MNWRQFVMDLETLDASHVEAILITHGACSVTLTDGGDNPVLEPGPGETPLWADTRITGLFDASANFDALTHDLLTTLDLDKLPDHEITDLADRVWEREWEKDFGPMRFGDKLWVCPGDSQAGSDDAVVVRLDPGLAFGTGTHATTALCLEWLDGLTCHGQRVLDVGCGSGVLAIAAIKLGAREAHGLDIDPQAITATRENASNNDVAEQVSTSIDWTGVDGEFDIVIANILAAPLIDLAETIAKPLASGGQLALSGILSAQIDEVVAAYEHCITFEEPVLMDQGGQQWACLVGKRS
ncbi:MAG: 50S ribosomal protein L11 methyltransferase [Pseudomonadota bacterium]